MIVTKLAITSNSSPLQRSIINVVNMETINGMLSYVLLVLPTTSLKPLLQ